MITIRKLTSGYLLKKDGNEKYYYSTGEMSSALPGLDTKHVHDLFENCPDITEIMIQTTINYIVVTSLPKSDIDDGEQVEPWTLNIEPKTN